MLFLDCPVYRIKIIFSIFLLNLVYFHDIIIHCDSILQITCRGVRTILNSKIQKSQGSQNRISFYPKYLINVHFIRKEKKQN
ncbi:hypothetical protein EUGRSUZ_B01413 [Eucalyptus grandis]|uniref:Uncharacterized protein n=2 Tax=Eucalyptus grandis TaxID=71139 RepID=A0A059D1G4_EUCGR|nr:hypothetical protein EUGRSUZ_B01413 [Eucalyptus grandis]